MFSLNSLDYPMFSLLLLTWIFCAELVNLVLSQFYSFYRDCHPALNLTLTFWDLGLGLY